jgi:hypothetical protein
MQASNRPLFAAIILPAALLLCQCATTPPRVSTSALVAGGHWVQVASHPPTFYPRGVAADCETDGHSGEWVDSADAQGSRFFIPFHGLGGVPRKTLVNEALATRSEQKVQQIAAEDRNSKIKSVLLNTVFVPFYALGQAPMSAPAQPARKDQGKRSR